MKQERRLFLIGAILGTLLDQLHVWRGVLYYKNPFFPGGQAFWVPILFGVAAVVLVKGYRIVTDLLAARDPLPEASSLWDTSTGFLLAYVATAFFHHSEILLTLGLMITWSWHLRRLPGEGGLPYCFLVAAGGTIFEILLASTGVFHYTNPDILGIPIWLFALYLHAALLLRTIALRYFRHQ